MEERNTVGMTALDSAIADSRLQMMKAAIPYVNMSEQRFIAVFAKVMELQNTLSFFTPDDEEGDLSACSLESDSKDPLDMLTDIREFSTGRERDSIDTMINVLHALDLYRTYQETMAEMDEESQDSADPFSMLKAFLPPEQQSMFDTYSMMMNTMT